MIVPKLNSSNVDIYDATKHNDKNYQVQFYLPPNVLWYNYFTKDIELLERGKALSKMLAIKEMLVYVRGGRILPIKLHNNKLSLIRAFNMPIKLEVYVDEYG